jgi:hypothetical protein
MVGFIIKRTDIDSTLFLEENAHNPACLFDDDKVTTIPSFESISSFIFNFIYSFVIS